MSLYFDRALSQAVRYANHLTAATTPAERDASTTAWNQFAAQFDDLTRARLTAVYTAAPLCDDRRTGWQASQQTWYPRSTTTV